MAALAMDSRTPLAQLCGGVNVESDDMEAPETKRAQGPPGKGPRPGGCELWGLYPDLLFDSGKLTPVLGTVFSFAKCRVECVVMPTKF